MIALSAVLLIGASLVLALPPTGLVVPWRSLAVATAAAAVGALAAGVLVGTPVVIALAAIAAAVTPTVHRRGRRERNRARVRSQWPDAIDTVRSGVRSGATLADAVAGAAPRVPSELAPRFQQVAAQLSVGVGFGKAVSALAVADDPVGDRVTAFLTLSDEIGSADTGRVLKALTDFLRADIAQQRDVAARHSWNVAAARIAVAAPWLTVAALSMQPGARAAYASAGGSVLLAAVAAITATAYAAMNRVGRARPTGPGGR